MGEQPTTRPPFDAADDASLVEGRITRNLNRRLFREMIKTDLEDQPLNWLRRRTFVRFAHRLGIDAFEARLIIRAVEYESGHASPPTAVESETSVDFDLIAKPGHEEATLRAVLLAVGLMMIVGGFLWLMRSAGF